ncbi:ABC transport system permease protein [Halalkaliarchaeum desulfuricum]|uniref:ABC transport system permease protein n=1 Tax=Halalkaliarchaeum desulfuricum TaxID=2055893 RepID=A0A343TJV9_9EURY|nr:ABC transporter permease [Halalkaliarchaeum desulfuricum]AUX09381.1 ABC transport system permease protein [Halalkaliarchaeum desulfuricum]
MRVTEWIRGGVSRTAGTVGFAIRGLRSDRMRTAFAVFGVVLAVLSVTLLVGVGVGVTETGEELFDRSDRDLWVSGGPVDIAPGTVGGFRNPVTDAHTVAAEIDGHEAVRHAGPMAFQVVYVSPDGEEFETLIGTGVPGGGPSIVLEDGEGFTGGDTHYADGSYDGPMTHQVIVDPATAERFDLAVGDTLHVGGTIGDARRNEFEVVGISPTFREFLGTGTATIRLSELQTLTGSAHEDRATLISVRLESGADPEAVRDELQEAYPAYDVRTNREQFLAVLERQAVVLAGGISLAALGVIAGAALSMNLLLSMVYAQRETFAVMRALGMGGRTVVGVALTQAVIVGIAGGAVGLLVTPAAAAGIETIAATVTGFEGLVQVPTEAYLAGGAIAAVFTAIGGVAGAVRVSRIAPLEQLTR